jgi:hypothetical protein
MRQSGFFLFGHSDVPTSHQPGEPGSQARRGSRPAFTSTRTTYQTAAMPPPAARAPATSCSNSIRHFPAIRQLPGCCASHLVPMKTVKRFCTYLAGRSGGSHSYASNAPRRRSQSVGPEGPPDKRCAVVASTNLKAYRSRSRAQNAFAKVCRRFMVSKLLIMVTGLLKAYEPTASP